MLKVFPLLYDISFPGQLSSPGTRPVPLWYFSKYLHTKQLLTWTAMQPVLLMRWLSLNPTSCKREIALSRSCRMKRATSLRGALCDFSFRYSSSLGRTSVMIGRSPKFAWHWSKPMHGRSILHPDNGSCLRQNHWFQPVLVLPLQSGSSIHGFWHIDLLSSGRWYPPVSCKVA